MGRFILICRVQTVEQPVLLLVSPIVTSLEPGRSSVGCPETPETILSKYIVAIWPAAAAKSLQSCPTLCNPIDGSPPGSPVPGILQARTLEWVAISSPMHKSESEVAQSCPTLHDCMDHSPPGSTVHGIFQARVLEWGAIAFSVFGLSGSQTVVRGDRLGCEKRDLEVELSKPFSIVLIVF